GGGGPCRGDGSVLEAAAEERVPFLRPGGPWAARGASRIGGRLLKGIKRSNRTGKSAQSGGPPSRELPESSNASSVPGPYRGLRRCSPAGGSPLGAESP